MTTRRALLLTLIAVLLAACSNSAPPAPTAAGVSVVDVRGQRVEFAAPPQRVFLATYRQVLDEMLMLDTAPIGYAAHPSEQLPVWTRTTLAERGIEVTPVTAVDGYDFESIAALRPDAIVAVPGDDAALNRLAEIAPLVVVDYQIDFVGTRLQMLGQMLGRADRATELASTMTDGLDQISASDETIALIFGYTDGGPRAALEFGDVKGREGEVLTRAGLKIKSDWPFAKNEYSYADVAEENFGLFDTADMVWNLAPYPGDRDRDEATMRGSRVLQSLQVYQRGDVVFLSSDLSQAMSQWTPLATPLLVREVNAILADRGASTP